MVKLVSDVDLARPPRGPAARRPARPDPRVVVERLLAIQAQDLTGARLAIRARATGVAVDDVDRALADRLLVTTWLNRGTLHLVRREDYPWLQALTAPTSRTANARRLVEEGLSIEAADRGVAVIVRALDGGPLSGETSGNGSTRPVSGRPARPSSTCCCGQAWPGGSCGAP